MLVSTYSIIAVDIENSEMGGAVQSHYFSVGSTVLWPLPGVGVVATQAMVNPDFGPAGLKLMEEGHSPADALAELLKSDSGKKMRQVALINRDGEADVFTGNQCIAEAGHIKGSYYSIQANMMHYDTVWQAMEQAFLHAKGPLAERLLAALKAAEAEGGDIRGRQSANIKLVNIEKTGEVSKDLLLDLRVDDNPEPLKELERLLKIHRAYKHADLGDTALGKGDAEKALSEYSLAEKLNPNNDELEYWHGLALAGMGREKEALNKLNHIYSKNSSWRELTKRVVNAGIVSIPENILKKII